MNQQTSDFLAKKLRQNWLTRAQELKTTKDQEDDDSLTNLAWLQNINLTKMAVPGTPLSPSWPSSDNLLNADANIKEISHKTAGGRAIRNTLELYRQHCNNHGFSVRGSHSSRAPTVARQAYLPDYRTTFDPLRPATRQPSPWWKAKSHRTFCRARGSAHTRLKFPLGMRNIFANYQLARPLVKGLTPVSTYSSLTPAGCYHFPSTPVPTTQAFVTVTSTPESTFPVQTAESDFLDQNRPVAGLETNYLQESTSFEQDPIQMDKFPLACTLPTIDDIDPEERQMFRRNQSARPPYSYTVLIYMSMEATKKTKITLNEIYAWVAENFAFYRNSEPTWKLALRQTLMRSTFFQRVPRRKEEPGGWGDIWRLNPEIRMQIKGGTQRKAAHGANAKQVSEGNAGGDNLGHLRNTSRRSEETAPPQSPTDVHWVRRHNSTSSSSPSSIGLHTPPPTQPLDSVNSPELPISRLLDFVAEDVSLLDNSIEDCRPSLDSLVQAQARGLQDLDEMDVLLSEDAEHAANLFKGCPSGSTSPDRTESPAKLDFTVRGVGLKRTMDWWPEDLANTVEDFIHNLPNPDFSIDKSASGKLGTDSDGDHPQIANFPDLPIDYPMTETSDEHPWVDDRLNLEELNSILGLN
ncbi:hypothetical protein AAHC03_023033 [Spirometra sp. Aus1]